MTTKDSKTFLRESLNANVHIVTKQCDIKNMIESKSVTSWGCGEEIEDGWIRLASHSPQRKGDLQTIYVCAKSLYEQAKS
jgi:hypothetical protein